MKLRQKLAVALATAMVVTAVPVVTMAASTNSLSKETVVVVKDQSATNTLNVKFNSPQTTEVFYLTISNAKWDDAMNTTSGTSNGATYTVTTQSSTVAKVVVTTTGINSSKTVQLPLLATKVTGEATVEITPGDSTISKGTFVMATTEAKSNSVTATAGTVNSFYTNGELAKISIKENIKGALTDGSVVTVELENSDFEFNFNKIATGTYNTTEKSTTYSLPAANVEQLFGFGGAASTITVDAKVYDKDLATAEFTINLNGTVADSKGTLVLKALPVKATTKTPDTGKLEVEVYAKNASGSKIMTSTTLEVATIADYGVAIAMKDDKAVETNAGQKQEIQFTISENIEDTIVAGREIELSLDNAYFAFEEDANGKVTFDIAVSKVNDGDGDTSKVTISDYEWVDEDDHAEGIKTITLSLASGYDFDDITMKGDVIIPIENKDKEAVTVTAEGRALGETISTKAISIVNPFNVTVEPMTVKVGLKGQTTGKITLTETAAEMLNKGEIKFALVTEDTKGLTFSGDAELAITGDLKKAELTSKTKDGVVTVKVPRQSKEAAAITVSDIEITVDRTVPEGSYDLVISGDAIDANGHSLTIEDFLVVGTPNTEDLSASNGLAKGTAAFVIGEAKYTVNGVEKTMDAASYVQDPGYTMIPVRYVAEAFGVSASDILFSNGTATIFAGNRTIQLTSGSNIAIVNGASVTMGTKVVIKEGRTYAPVGEVARILGISTAWDSASKTATFTNN